MKPVGYGWPTPLEHQKSMKDVEAIEAELLLEVQRSRQELLEAPHCCTAVATQKLSEALHVFSDFIFSDIEPLPARL
jgi:hypothetical protein